MDGRDVIDLVESVEEHLPIDIDDGTVLPGNRALLPAGPTRQVTTEISKVLPEALVGRLGQVHEHVVFPFVRVNRA